MSVKILTRSALLIAAGRNPARRHVFGLRAIGRFALADEELRSMPYRTNADLPPSVARHLPQHAQDIYREAFNHAFEAHAGDPRQEEASHRIAWAAVKRGFAKIGTEWVARRSDDG